MNPEPQRPRDPSAKPKFCRGTHKLLSLEGIAPNTDKEFKIERSDIASDVEDTNAALQLVRDGAVEALWLFAEERGQQVKELQAKLEQVRSIVSVVPGKRKSGKRAYDAGPGAIGSAHPAGVVGAGLGAGGPPNDFGVHRGNPQIEATAIGSIETHTALSAELAKTITDAFEFVLITSCTIGTATFMLPVTTCRDRRRSRSRGTLWRLPARADRRRGGAQAAIGAGRRRLSSDHPQRVPSRSLRTGSTRPAADPGRSGGTQGAARGRGRAGAATSPR